MEANQRRSWLARMVAAEARPANRSNWHLAFPRFHGQCYAAEAAAWNAATFCSGVR